MEELNLNLKPLIKRLEVTSKRGMTGVLTGSYKSSFRGKGLEFEGYRKYEAGDDAGMIDWKATLRSEDVMIKILTEERNVNVVFMFDVSSSMSFASIDKLKNEYAAELIAVLSFASIQAGDSVGLVMFTDHIVKMIHPAMGIKQYFMITRSLSDPRFYDGAFDFNKTLMTLMDSLSRGTILIMVSDFIGLGEGWERHLKAAAEKFEIIGIMVRDPRDSEMPDDVGEFVISDPFSNKEMLIDTGIIKEQYEAEVKKMVAHIKQTFTESRSQFIELRTDSPFLHDLLKLFMMRGKKAR